MPPQVLYSELELMSTSEIKLVITSSPFPFFYPFCTCWLPNSPIFYPQNGVTAGQISEVRAAEEKSKRKWYKLLVKSSHKRMSDLLRKHGGKAHPVIAVSLTYDSCILA